MTAGSLRCVTLDAMGTLVALDRPFDRLAEELAARGASVSRDEARAALGAEMAYYRAHHDEAVDDASLTDLRARCADVLIDALPPTGLEPPAVLDALLGALRFVALPGTAEALRAWREAGVARVVVSNWDVSLHGVLRDVGLADLVDGVITSAEARIGKPAAEVFVRALAVVGCLPGEALHVGDSLEHDVAGALAAGMQAALIVDEGPFPVVPPGVRCVRGLIDLSGPDSPLP